jgi:uncharacterized coiled-coil DUF342 family protein
MSGLKFFFTTMSFFFLLWGISAASAEKRQAPPSVQEQVSAIDDQIRDLEDLKRGYESRALRHDDQALRLQFDQRWNLEVRRHLELADENRTKAALVQKEIDRLKAKRKELIDQYGAPDFEDL